jgi:hypothetical protein
MRRLQLMKVGLLYIVNNMVTSHQTLRLEAAGLVVGASDRVRSFARAEELLQGWLPPANSWLSRLPKLFIYPVYMTR